MREWIPLNLEEVSDRDWKDETTGFIYTEEPHRHSANEVGVCDGTCCEYTGVLAPEELES